MAELKWEITNDFGDKEPQCLSVKLKDLPYSAFIKWDGCCDVHHTLNEGCKSEDVQDMHICSISDFITILQSLEDFRMNNIRNAE